MSFQKFPTQKTLYKLNQIKHRKEPDSFMVNHFHQSSYKKSERASSFISKGSITLEAALVIPIFFFAILCMAFLLEMMAIQTTVHHALHSVGKELAQTAYVSPVVSTYGIEQKVVENIGTDRLEKSMIVGGAEGIDCSYSRSDMTTSVIELSACYELEIPVLMFDIPVISREESVRVKGWTGYAAGAGGTASRQVVYVTDYGLVYHKEMNCTYLELSVRSVNKESIEELRNQSGGKYHACQSCGKDLSVTDILYVTDYGDRYHTSLDCSKIKRNVYAVPLDEVYGLGGCSKCVK